MSEHTARVMSHLHSPADFAQSKGLASINGSLYHRVSMVYHGDY